MTPIPSEAAPGSLGAELPRSHPARDPRFLFAGAVGLALGMSLWAWGVLDPPLEPEREEPALQRAAPSTPAPPPLTWTPVPRAVPAPTPLAVVVSRKPTPPPFPPVTRRELPTEPEDGVASQRRFEDPTPAPPFSLARQEERHQPREILPPLEPPETEALTRAIRQAVESYAFPWIGVKDVEAHVQRLSRDQGTDVVLALWEECRYARSLLTALDDNQAYLERRSAKLAKKALAVRNPNAPRLKNKRETQQRQLELTNKKIAIQLQQRNRLMAMCRALEAGLGRMDAPAAGRRLARALKKEKDPELRRALRKALATSRAREAIPVLIDELARRRHAAGIIQDTLRRITGQDLGPKPAPWRAWWKAEKKREDS